MMLLGDVLLCPPVVRAPREKTPHWGVVTTNDRGRARRRRLRYCDASVNRFRWPAPCHPIVCCGSFPDVGAPWIDVRFTPTNRPRFARPSGPKSADIVAKVENRAARKNSPKWSL